MSKDISCGELWSVWLFLRGLTSGSAKLLGRGFGGGAPGFFDFCPVLDVLCLISVSSLAAAALAPATITRSSPSFSGTSFSSDRSFRFCIINCPKAKKKAWLGKRSRFEQEQLKAERNERYK